MASRAARLLLTAAIVWFVVFVLPNRFWWTVPILMLAAGTALAMMQGHRVTVTGGVLAATAAVGFSVLFWMM